MSPFELLFVAAAVGGIALVARKGACCPGRFSARTLLVVALVVVGASVMWSRATNKISAARAQRIAAAHFSPPIPRIEVNVPDIKVDFDHKFPFRAIREATPIHVEHDFSMTWSLIAGAIVVLIVGSVFLRGRRAQPRTIKLLSVIGVGAILYAVVSFFDSPPRTVVSRDVISHDRVIKPVSAPSEAGELKRIEKSKRATRAKRPSARPRRDADVAPENDVLPPRAGEIPVSAELATAAEPQPAPPAPTPPSAPAAVPATPPPPEAAPADEPPASSDATPAPTTPAAATPPAPADAVPAVVAAPPAKPGESAAPKAEQSASVEAVDAPSTIAPTASTKQRPAWVDAPPRLEDSVYSVAVESGLFVSVPECQRQLDSHIKHEVDHYIDEYLGEGASRLVDIPLSYLKEHVQKQEYSEVTVRSVGPMHQIYALLQIDDRARGDFQRRWHDAVVTDRLWYFGSGATLLLALLATFYGYLKLDLRTGGSHKARLQLAATLVALLVAASTFLVRWAVPF